MRLVITTIITGRITTAPIIQDHLIIITIQVLQAAEAQAAAVGLHQAPVAAVLLSEDSKMITKGSEARCVTYKFGKKIYSDR